MPIILVAPVRVEPPPPPPPPAPVEPPRDGLRHTLFGWDGSVWELDDESTGTLLVSGGVRGMGMPPMNHNRTVSPAVPGSYYRGTRVEDRSVFWPLYLFHDGTAQDWIAHNRRFWSALRPTETSVWRVVQPTSEARYLDVRYESGGDEPYEVDPAFSGWTLHGLGLVADKPYWRGDPITRDFDSPETTRSNFGPPGVLHIYAGSSFDTATITNPGDLAVRVTWVLRGPLDSAKVGVGNKTIDVPFSIAAGSTLTIYTDDDLMLALDEDGVDRTGALGPTTDMTGVVAPGGDGALSVRPVWSAVGGGVSAVLTPLFYMAF